MNKRSFSNILIVISIICLNNKILGQEQMNEVKKGIYKHYSGKEYEVLEENAIHSETYEEMVIYKALYDCPKFGKNKVWCRPKKMFTETVKYNDLSVPRFKLIQELK